MADCSEPGCPNPSKARTLCGTHYGQRSRDGTLPPLPTLADSLEAHVDRLTTPDGCHLGTMPPSSKGYGRFMFQRTNYPLHVIACELAHGPMPTPGMQACHHCDVPMCANPAHLYWGTVQDNSDDRVNRDRQARGVRNWNARLTEDDVRAIRRLASEGTSRQELARRFGVTDVNIGFIVRRRSWKHVT